MNYQYSFKVNNKDIPYYHFRYEKEFKEVLRLKDIQKSNKRNRYYWQDGTYLPQFISEETTKQFNFKSNYVTFERVMIIIIHWFSDYIPKDLDNYYYKPFIDVVRRLKIIDNDSWEQVGIMNTAAYAEKERIEIYIIPYQYFIDFLDNKFSYLFEGNYQILPINEKRKLNEMADCFFDDDGFF